MQQEFICCISEHSDKIVMMEEGYKNSAKNQYIQNKRLSYTILIFGQTWSWMWDINIDTILFLVWLYSRKDYVYKMEECSVGTEYIYLPLKRQCNLIILLYLWSLPPEKSVCLPWKPSYFLNNLIVYTGIFPVKMEMHIPRRECSTVVKCKPI